MTDQEIIEVVTAHKEGKKIESKWNRNLASSDWELMKWHECENPTWDFGYYDYRVAPEPRKELWLQECTRKGLWQEKFTGLGRHFIEVEEVTSGEPTVISSTVKTFPETSPRKPIEMWLLKSVTENYWMECPEKPTYEIGKVIRVQNA